MRKKPFNIFFTHLGRFTNKTNRNKPHTQVKLEAWSARPRASIGTLWSVVLSHHRQPECFGMGFPTQEEPSNAVSQQQTLLPQLIPIARNQFPSLSDPINSSEPVPLIDTAPPLPDPPIPVPVQPQPKPSPPISYHTNPTNTGPNDTARAINRKYPC